MSRTNLAVLVVLAACSQPSSIPISKPRPLPQYTIGVLDPTPKATRRMIPAEAFLRSYLMWFGGLAPDQAHTKLRGFGLFDEWRDYLAALGLPDYKLDVPRANQSNTIMLATVGRLAEALCIRTVEHDLYQRRPIEDRLIFAFDLDEAPALDTFTRELDVLHRTFLSYPIALAPPDRPARFFAMFESVRKRHAANVGERLPALGIAWAAVCSALVQHPETGLY